MSISQIIVSARRDLADRCACGVAMLLVAAGSLYACVNMDFRLF